MSVKGSYAQVGAEADMIAQMFSTDTLPLIFIANGSTVEKKGEASV